MQKEFTTTISKIQLMNRELTHYIHREIRNLDPTQCKSNQKFPKSTLAMKSQGPNGSVKRW
jgi:hypothetical protein